jgi:hypothetical protein
LPPAESGGQGGFRLVHSGWVIRVPTVTDLDQDPTAVIETGDWVKVDADRGLWKSPRKMPDANELPPKIY